MYVQCGAVQRTSRGMDRHGEWLTCATPATAGLRTIHTSSMVNALGLSADGSLVVSGHQVRHAITRGDAAWGPISLPPSLPL